MTAPGCSLTNDEAVIAMVENYCTSDGYGRGRAGLVEHSQDRHHFDALWFLHAYQVQDPSCWAQAWEDAKVRGAELLDRRRAGRWRSAGSSDCSRNRARSSTRCIAKLVEGRGPVEDQEASRSATLRDSLGEVGRYAGQPATVKNDKGSLKGSDTFSDVSRRTLGVRPVLDAGHQRRLSPRVAPSLLSEVHATCAQGLEARAD